MKQGIRVELTTISKCYGHRCLFENISLSLEPGQCLTITGPNGSGKSTFLKIISGLVRPTTGMIRLFTADGQEIPSDERTKHIGLISPKILFYTMLTGYENIVFITRIAGITVSQEKIMAYCQVVGLAGRENDKISTYSTGMCQRLKFALLLALKPPILLLDEPFSNLDTTGREVLDTLIKKALNNQITIAIATNEAKEATYAGKKFILA